MTTTYPQPPVSKNVVSIASARAGRDRSVGAAWERFVEAQERSKRTLSIADGIAAGKAYAAFLSLFIGRGA